MSKKMVEYSFKTRVFYFVDALMAQRMMVHRKTDIGDSET